MFVIFFRSIILYLLLLFMFRFMGKRQVGELEISDLVTTLLLSEIAALPIDDPDIPLTYALVPILLIMCLEVITTWLETKYNPLKKLFQGKPIMLVSRGQVDINALRKMRITLNELISECRTQGIGDIRQVNYAILEPNGKLSVLPKAENSPITPSYLSNNGRDDGILHPLVIDGVVQKQILTKLSISEEKFYRLCKKEGGEAKDFFLLGIDDFGQSYAIKKEAEK